MKPIIAVTLLFFSNSLFAENNFDHSSAKIRLAILKDARKAESKRDYDRAASYYQLGIENWKAKEQKKDLKRACQNLFAMLYRNGQEKERRNMLDGCPASHLAKWYGEVDRPPIPLLKVTPVMPKKARKKEIDGYVVLEYDVSKEGKVENVKIVESSNDIFNKTSILAVNKYVYLPKIKGGMEIETKAIRQKLNYRNRGNANK